jgi:hypothetical protein
VAAFSFALSGVASAGGSFSNAAFSSCLFLRRAANVSNSSGLAKLIDSSGAMGGVAAGSGIDEYLL